MEQELWLPVRHRHDEAGRRFQRYRYVDPFNFPDNWRDTPGRYYWQVFYYPEGGVGVLPSAVGSSRIN